MDDLALAQAVAAGKPGALEALTTAYGKRLYRFCYYLRGRSHDEAADLVQDTLLAALQTIGGYSGRSKLSTWLCGVAWHIARRQRQSKAAQTESRQSKLEFDLADPGLDPESTVIASEPAAEVGAWWTGLPAEYRQVLWLRYGEGLSVAETAQRMGRSKRATASLVIRAKGAAERILFQTRRTPTERCELRRAEIQRLWPLHLWSVRGLAAHLGVSYTCVQNDLKALGLEPQNPRGVKRRERGARIAALTADGHTPEDISRIIGVTVRTVYNHIKEQEHA